MTTCERSAEAVARETASLLLREWLEAQDDASRAGLYAWSRVRGSLGDRIAAALTQYAAAAVEVERRHVEAIIAAHACSGTAPWCPTHRQYHGDALCVAIRRPPPTQESGT